MRLKKIKIFVAHADNYTLLRRFFPLWPTFLINILPKNPMINYTVYLNENSNEWVTFVHGAGGSSTIWFKQIRDFKSQYNVLLLDLRGHGDSKSHLKKAYQNKYTFESIANDIIEVIDHLNIAKSHFIGISLGTILIRQLAEMYPERVQSMVMGGAVLRMNFRSQVLMTLANTFKYVLPYLMLYKVFAYVIMPTDKNKQSRSIFINEAKKLYQKEFIKWFRLTAEINPVLRIFRQVELNIPTFYVMGEDDFMFLPIVQLTVKKHVKSSKLFIIEKCGHVVNVEAPAFFNREVLSFLKTLKPVREDPALVSSAT